MRFSRIPAAGPALSAAVVALSVASCSLIPSRHHPTIQVDVPAAEASALVLILDPAMPSAQVAARSLLAATARPGERLVLLDERSGALIASSTVPQAGAVTLPAPPPPPPKSRTRFQEARYQQALGQYEATLRAIEASHRRQQQRLVAASAAAAFTAIFTAKSHPVAGQRAAGEAGIRTSVSAAAADVSSLRQAGLGLGSRTVIVILGLDETAVVSAPRLRAGLLPGGTVVITSFPRGSDAEAAWQADLIQAGASRAVLLTSAASNQLGDVVRQGLDGAITDNLTSVLFGRDQYTLRPAAHGQLQHLLHLLTVVYPKASASINGYTDDLPAPGGNRELSIERADAVRAWLIVHGVAPVRLQASGHGSADPVAPNAPGGQPRNRRVAVLIDPAVQGSA